MLFWENALNLLKTRKNRRGAHQTWAPDKGIGKKIFGGENGKKDRKIAKKDRKQLY